MRLGGDGDEKGRTLVVDAMHRIFLTGQFSQTTLFGDAQITSFGAHDVFVSKLMSPPIVNIVKTGGNALISWPAYATNCILQSCNTFSPGSWSDVIPMGTNTSITLVPPSYSGQEFYRLKFE
jgi:hypothetical protein